MMPLPPVDFWLALNAAAAEPGPPNTLISNVYPHFGHAVGERRQERAKWAQ